MNRTEFTKKTKAAAFLRCGGLCEACQLKIIGTPEYDHILPDALSGDNSLENCRVLCSKCHDKKSYGKEIASNSSIARATRLAEKHVGLRKKSARGFKGHCKFDGSVVWKR